MNIKRIIFTFCTILLVELAALALLIGLIISGQQELAQAEKLRFRAFGVADELRQSSDDLTRMARTFASTGNKSFEQYFQDILDIRDGKIPRPPNYERVYWDFVVAGQKLPGATTDAISLDANLRSLELTPEETKLLAEAKSKSDALVDLENKASMAVNGLVVENGKTVQRAPDMARARTLLFGSEYHIAKADIMRPINEFLISIDERLNKAVADRRKALAQLEIYSAAIVGLTLLTFLAFAFTIQRKVLAPIGLLLSGTEAIQGGKYGDKVDIKSTDEIGALAGALNRMSSAIALDVNRRSQNEAELRQSRDQAEAAVNELRQTQEQLVRNQAELSKNQDILKGLADSLPVFVSVKDPDGRYIFVNRLYEHWSGVKRNQIIGKTLFDIYDEEQARAIHARDQSVVSSLKPKSDESTRTYPDGVTRTVLRTRVPVKSRSGELLGVATVNHDISERKAAEAALKQSEERYALAMESAGEGLWDWDLEADTLNVSPQFAKLMGLDTDAITIRPEVWTERVHPDDLASYQKTLKAHLIGDSESILSEFRVPDENDNTRLIEAHGKGHRNEQGRVFRIAGSVTDVTQRREAEERLKQSEASIRALIDNSPSEIVIKDIELKYVRVNRIFEEHYGVSNDDIVGKSARSFLPESMVAPIDEQDRQVMAKGIASEIELETVVDGEKRYNLESKFPIRDDDRKVIGIAGIAADITDKKAAEKELLAAKEQAESALAELKLAQARLVTTEKMASLGQLTAGIAHEIKNPLNFVNNFSETSIELLDELKDVIEPAQKHLSDEDQDDVEDILDTLKGDLDKIHQHGSRADGIVKSMLLHARGDSTDHAATSINGLIEEAMQLAYHGERARDKSFQATLDEQYGDDVGEVDLVPQDITRVVVNLLSNAFYAVKKRAESEASKEYVPTVSVKTISNGEEVEIYIRDNGLGMSIEIREKLFEPFFTTKPTGEGTGLGLSMCFDVIVHQHDGHIEVDSKPNDFTEFKITLPRESQRGLKGSENHP